MKKLIIICILALFLFGFICEAQWDASAFELGESNHLWKILFIGTWLIVLYFAKYLNKIYDYLLTVGIYLTIRYGLFDLFINNFRDLDPGYKTGNIILKWISLIITIGLIIIYWLYNSKSQAKKVVTKAKRATRRVTSGTKRATKKVVQRVVSPTPRWAQWCRNIGAICAGIGGGMKMYPAEFPEYILQYENKILLIGVVTMIIFQTFKKS